MNDKTKAAINKIIDETGFRHINKFKDAVKKKFPDISVKKLKEIFNERTKDPKVNMKKYKPMMIKIFSSSTDTWFHDIFDNRSKGIPKYYHIFIGTNNRYAVAYPIEDKSAITLLNSSYKPFVEKFKPVKITSDDDYSLLAENVLQYLKSKNVRVQKVIDKNHSTLGIIDRFIRTLRDMHGNSSSKSININPKQMEKYINTYNNSYHRSINCTPKEMFDNPALEEAYIFSNLKKRDEQRQMNDFELKEGEFVKYLLPKRHFEKVRFRYSPESYSICGRDGNNYILMAKDGTTITKPRYQLIKANNAPKANTIQGVNKGVIKKVIGDAGKNKVKVLFELPDGGTYEDAIPKSYIRSRFNQTADLPLK